MGYNKYQISFQNDKIEIIEGQTLSHALSNAGYGHFNINEIKTWEKLPIDDE